VAELLESSENNLKDQKLLTPAELKAVETMNLDQVNTTNYTMKNHFLKIILNLKFFKMKEKRAEFLKLKALQSYQEAKFKRVKRIKSKRFRKILRKEKEKQEEKNLDRLEKEDPLQFKDVLEQIEKKRMKVSLNFFV
jgi:U3 small nucleolar RNA-associated protein 14